MIEKFNENGFVPVPRVPEWPVFQPESLPTTWKLIAEKYEDRNGDDYNWKFYFDQRMLIIYHHRDGFNVFNGKPARYIEQYEFPIEAAGWFVRNIRRFFAGPHEEGGLKTEDFSVDEECGGERLNISRLFHTIGEDIPGYSLDNLSRAGHPNRSMCQSFIMSDKFLFSDGMLELFKDIANRYEQGLL